jgi:uncharacterized protein (TIGR02147 family)
MTPNVYDYSEPRTFLRDMLAEKQNHNPLFSIRAWARQMGFQCHTSLVFFLNGKRKIRPEHFDRLNKGLRLSGSEEAYFRNLVHMHCSKTESERSHYEANLQLLKPTKEEALVDMEKFKLIADWIHMAILEMTKLGNFEGSAEWIAKRLKVPLPIGQIQEAIDRLVYLGLLKWEDGRLVKTNERLTTPKDRSSECAREHHKQVIRNALISVEEQDLSERILNSCAMTIDSSRLEEAKQLILRFRSDLAKLMEKDGGDETYQLSVQFFKITDNKARENQ